MTRLGQTILKPFRAIYGAITEITATWSKDFNRVLNHFTNSESEIDVEKLLLPAARVVFLPIVALWLLFFILFVVASPFLSLSDSLGPFGDSFNLLNSLVSGLALGAIVVSLFLQRMELKATLVEMKESTDALKRQAGFIKFERDRNVREFAATFHSERMKQARTAAFYLRAPFFKDSGFRGRFAGQWVDIEEIEPSQYLKGEIKKHHPEYEGLGGHTWGVSDIIEYYSMIFHHVDSLEDAEKRPIARLLADRYIWSYWRGMILVLAYEVLKRYEEQVTTGEERMHFPRPNWIRDICMFDELVGMDEYKPGVHPREKPYKSGDVEFDMKLLHSFAREGC